MHMRWICVPLIITSVILFALAIMSDNSTTSNILANIAGPILGAGLVLLGARKYIHDFESEDRH